MTTRISFSIPAQPTETTCGPTCLHAVYRYYGDDISLDQVIAETRSLREGGTLDAFLAHHALRRGYSATIYLHNLKLFDPTWFELSREQMVDKLRNQRRIKEHTHPKIGVATNGYIRFLELGGALRMTDLNGRLLRKYLRRGVPLLTGLSSTWLYRAARELDDTTDDDLRGEPAGHFVVVHGYDRDTREAWVADPWEANPFSEARQYPVKVDRLIASVLLGVMTFDCNLLVIQPRKALS
jgi:hypothetical protein